MPKRPDLKSILIIGAGPIVIGQACEFDYSGTQACKALREEGYRVILVNSNPATIMTDPDTADATYIEPVRWQTVEKIIEKERPDAILPTMGGQTALNTALALFNDGTLEKYGVQMIGANADAIDKAEDRQRFREAMDKIGLESARSGVAHTVEEALAVLETTGLPSIIRPSFTMGGTDGGINVGHRHAQWFWSRPTVSPGFASRLVGRRLGCAPMRHRLLFCLVLAAIAAAVLIAMKSGGHPIDAAVAVAFTLGVVDGHNSGIGGGCFMLIRRANGEFDAQTIRHKAQLRAMGYSDTASLDAMRSQAATGGYVSAAGQLIGPGDCGSVPVKSSVIFPPRFSMRMAMR